MSAADPLTAHVWISTASWVFKVDCSLNSILCAGHLQQPLVDVCIHKALVVRIEACSRMLFWGFGAERGKLIFVNSSIASKASRVFPTGHTEDEHRVLGRTKETANSARAHRTRGNLSTLLSLSNCNCLTCKRGTIVPTLWVVRDKWRARVKHVNFLPCAQQLDKHADVQWFLLVAFQSLF